MCEQKYSVEDLRAQTEGVECRKDSGVLDEIPTASKDIDKVMAQQADLVEIVAELKQVLCIKGLTQVQDCHSDARRSKTT